MGFIPDEDQQFLRDKFASELNRNVRLLLFTKRESPLILPGAPQEDLRFLNETLELMEEIAGLSPKISLEVYDQQADAATWREYGVDKLPAVMVQADGAALRFFGVPGGYEFSTFIQDIFDLSQDSVKLSQETQDYLRGLDKDVHIQVFVTPTCPYCPQAAWMAHQMMMVNPQRVTADVIEANEFPDYAQRYQVYAVPRVVINDATYFEGALPEETFVEHIVRAVEAPTV